MLKGNPYCSPAPLRASDLPLPAFGLRRYSGLSRADMTKIEAFGRGGRWRSSRPGCRAGKPANWHPSGWVIVYRTAGLLTVN